MLVNYMLVLNEVSILEILTSIMYFSVKKKEEVVNKSHVIAIKIILESRVILFSLICCGE